MQERLKAPPPKIFDSDGTKKRVNCRTKCTEKLSDYVEKLDTFNNCVVVFIKIYNKTAFNVTFMYLRTCYPRAGVVQ